jgi:hypothetical protein
MAEQIDNRLIYAILESIQGRLAAFEGMSAEMRTMRALLRTRRDTAFLEAAWPSWRARWSASSAALAEERW